MIFESKEEIARDFCDAPSMVDQNTGSRPDVDVARLTPLLRSGEMYIYSCADARNLPPLPQTLTRLIVHGCLLSDLPELPNTLQALQVSDCPNLTRLPALPEKLTSLRISNCPLTSLPPIPKTVHDLKIDRCHGLTDVPPPLPGK